MLQQESKTAAVLRCIQNLTLSLDFDLLDFLYQFPMVNLFIWLNNVFLKCENIMLTLNKNFAFLRDEKTVSSPFAPFW